ncbi:MAG: glycosyltransferase [Bryobacterales bacterium]
MRLNKGVAVLLEALDIVLRNRANASATLAGGPDGWHDLPPRVRLLVERANGSAGQAASIGTGRADAGRNVSPSRGVRVSSHAEAFGLACVEAMSCGAAVIASPIGAGAEIVENERAACWSTCMTWRHWRPQSSACSGAADGLAFWRRGAAPVLARYSLRKQHGATYAPAL